MRLLEGLLAGSTVALLLGDMLLRFGDTTRWVLAAVLVGIAAVQVALEGPRYQLHAVYLCAALVVVLVAANVRHWAAFAVVTAVVALAGLLAWLWPVFVLPRLTGPHKVLGTRWWGATDARRPMGYGLEEPRELMMQMWFPAGPAPVDARPESYMEEAAVFGAHQMRVFSTALPSFGLNHLRHVRTRSFRDAEPVDGARLRLLVYSHGYTGSRKQATAAIEELASHGFAVLAVDHTHDASAVVFEDGRVAEFRAGPPPGIGTDQLRVMRHEQLLLRTGDVSFAIDEAQRINSNPTHPLYGRLDFSNGVGVFGHSFGGATALMALQKDARVSAAVGLDPWSWPLGDDFAIKNQEGGRKKAALVLQAPRFFAEDEPWTRNNRALLGEIAARSTSKMWIETVDKTTHHDFMDLPMYSRVFAWVGMSGGRGFEDLHRRLTRGMRTFFEARLKR